MREKLRLVVLGIMGQMPVAGVAWQGLHYLEGFRRLGFDVYYVEDTGAWPYDPERNAVTERCAYAVDYLGRLMEGHGLSGRWAYRAAAQGGRTFGLSEARIRALFERADVLVNVTGSTVLRDEHLQVPVRVYLETDPVLPQIEAANGDEFTLSLLDAHTHHFTYGENLGAPDCPIPLGRFQYRPTRQPVVLDWWSPAVRPVADAQYFTTIANWRQAGKDFEWNGERYTWSKHHEFLKFVDLPRRTSQPLGLALAWSADADAEAVRLLYSRGWRVIDAVSLSKQPSPYRDYILKSRGEFTVAKDQNVRLRSGWFSDRSACYLAAGRPVVTQDTAFGKILPTGEGLFAFNTMEEVVAAFEVINADYEKHSRAARAIAEEYLRAETVLGRLAAQIGL